MSALSVCALSAAVAVSACDSDRKKKRGGGDAGDAALGGQSGSGGTPATTGGDPGTSEGGAAGSGGAAGGEPGTQCPRGFGDCDQDPDDCETALDTTESCGECGTTCSSTNGISECEELSCIVTSCSAGFADCNDSGIDGCETPIDTVTDCGSCGNDCGTGTCDAGGFCNSVDIGSNAYTARSFFAGDSIYRQSVPAANDGLQNSFSIIRTPVDGSAETLIDTQNEQAGGMVASATDLYWAVGGTPPGVFKKSLDAAADAPPTPVFAPSSLPMQMLIQAENLYFMGLDGQIYRRPLAAAANVPGTVIVTAAEVAGTHTFNIHQPLVATPTCFYWIVLGAGGPFLRTALVTGGAARDVPGATPRGWTPPALDGEDVYWAQYGSSAVDGVYRTTHGNPALNVVLEANVTGVAIDSGSLYYMATETELYEAPLSGGVGQQIGLASSGAKDIVGFGPKSTYLSGSWTRGNGFYFSKAYVLSK